VALEANFTLPIGSQTGRIYNTCPNLQRWPAARCGIHMILARTVAPLAIDPFR
jgi:hypothetical protein